MNILTIVVFAIGGVAALIVFFTIAAFIMTLIAKAMCWAEWMVDYRIPQWWLNRKAETRKTES